MTTKEEEFNKLYSEQKVLAGKFDNEQEVFIEAKEAENKKRAEESFNKLATYFYSYEENNKKLNVLNEQGEFDARSYFVENHFTDMESEFTNSQAALEELKRNKTDDNVETFDELYANQRTITEEIDKMKNDFKKGNQQTRKKRAPVIIERLAKLYNDLIENNKKLMSLNTSGKYDKHNYFSANIFIVGRGKYQDLKTEVNKHIKPEEERSEDETDDTKKELKEIRKQMEKMMLVHQKTANELAEIKANKNKNGSAGGNESSMENMMKAFRTTKHEVGFPKFPTDLSEYREYRQQVDAWFDSEGTGMKAAAKLRKIKESCRDCPSAWNIVKKYDSTETNFKKCMIELDRRFLVVRNVMFDIIETLINMERVDRNSEHQLRNVYDIMTPAMQNLDSLIRKHVIGSDDTEDPYVTMKVKVMMLDGIFAAFLFRKLDPATRTEIARSLELEKTDVPNPEEMLKIVESKFINLHNCQDIEYPEEKPQRKTFVKMSTTFTGQKKSRAGYDIACLVCGKPNHTAPTCKVLLNITSLPERFKKIKNLNICPNCLISPKGRCKCWKEENKSYCKHANCRIMHNDVLHDPNWKPTRRNTANLSNVIVAAKSMHKKYAIIPTARIRMIAPNGMICNARALLDSGATDTFITYELANKLQLRLKNTDVKTRTYCDEPGASIKHEVNVTIKPHFENSFKLKCNAFLSQKLAGITPTRYVMVDTSTLKNNDNEFKLADEDFAIPGKIDVILGVNELAAIWGARCHKLQGTCLMETALGYVFMGGAEAYKPHESRQASCQTRGIEDIGSLSKFFDYDEVKDDEKEDWVEQFYQNTVTRNEKGYTVKIPWHEDNELGDSKRITVGRIRSMLRRLSPEMRKSYVQQNEQMILAGYMIPAPKGKQAMNYIANFALQTKSLTTPVRILYTCDQKTTNGRSVNDVQHTGPKLQSDLAQCVFKFRFRKFATSSDISKMFLQMKLDAEDALFQHTFIGEDPNGPLTEMQLTTVIFGMKSSPFLALRTLLQVADDEESENPKGSELLRNNFYVDDMLASFNTKQEAIEAIAQIVKATENAHFHLRKWAASDDSVLVNIPAGDKVDAVSLEIDKDKETEHTEEQRVFGMSWTRTSDVLHYKINVTAVENPTKRSTVSAVAKIYDLTGSLLPAMMVGKLQIQEVWKTTTPTEKEISEAAKKRKIKADWDTPLESKLAKQVKAWQEELKILEQIKVNRWIHHAPGQEDMLIGFADASYTAYGCVIYWRAVDKNGKVWITQIGAKGKVAPLSKNFVPVKKMDELTIPRLELMAATMLAEFIQKIKAALKLGEKFPIKAFTDSQITLAWIQGDDNRWNTFVSNRVRKIKAIIPAENWYYVNTKVNPADLASRGMMPKELVQSKLWFDGPEFIHQGVIDCTKAKFSTNMDEKKHVAVIAVTIIDESWYNEFEQVSTWTKTVRICAFVLRMTQKLHNLRQIKANQNIPQIKWSETLGVKECINAEHFIIKTYQRKEFAAEVASLTSGSPVTEGRLKGVTPFLDKEGVLRVGGRIGKATFMSYNERHPVILPKLLIPKNRDEEDVKYSSLTKKIIIWGHLTTLHGGEMKTISFLKQRFHIPNARNAVRYMIYRCYTCRVQKAAIYKQLMGNLPTDSLNPAPVFYHTTLDYAGPIAIQYNSRGLRRKTTAAGEIDHMIHGKAWIAVFVCRVVGAYHIELVCSLTAKACVEAFKRFVSTRGLPATVRSDNATTFIKARKMLKIDEQKAFDIAVKAIKDGEKELQTMYSTQKVHFNEPVMKWHYNPPLAPDFGGKHEAAVKQVKIHLKKVIGNEKLSYPAYMTVLKQIEAVLNSRPLCKAEGTAFDRDQILTPAHYWLGRPLTALPEPDYTQIDNLADRFLMQQKMVQHFWKLYSGQYLGQLMNLPKWTKAETNMRVGEIVLLKEKDTPPLVWRRARVTEVTKGTDGKVRVGLTEDATKKEFKRTIRQLVKLPIIIGRDDAAIAAGRMPLPAPIQKTQSTVNPPTKKVTNNATDPGTSNVRRSTRKKTALKSALVLTMLCLMTCIVPTVAQQQNGLMFFQEKDILVKIGTHHVNVETNLTPKKTIETIKAQVKTYGEQCDKSRATFKTVYCRAEAHQINSAANSMIEKIEGMYETHTRRRMKRETHRRGALERIWEWLVGSDEAEDDLSAAKSMGVLSHAVQSFKNIERELQKKEVNVENELKRLAGNVDAEMSKWVKSADETSISIILLSTSTILLENIKTIEETFMGMNKFFITQDEMEDLIGRLNRQVDEGQVLPVNQDLLRKMITVKTVVTEDYATIILGIPITLKDIFNEYFVMAVPEQGTHQMPDVEPQNIIINQRLQQFIESTDCIDINETMSITAETVNVFYKLTAESSCIMAAILNHTGKCPMKTLPEKYDVWRVTPLHNTFGYYSNQQKEMICKETRETLKNESGIVTIPRDCYIQTPSKIIRATKDKNAIVKHVFRMDVESQPQLINVTKIRTKVDFLPNQPTAAINDSELDAVMKDAVIAVQEWSMTSIILVTVAGTVGTLSTILVVIMCWYYNCRSSGNARSGTNNPRQNSTSKTDDEDAVYQTVTRRTN